MLKDVTLGQYYPVDSVLHRLDPRTKLAGTLIYIVALFCCDNRQSYALATAFVAVRIGLSRVPLSYMLRGLKGILFILLISVSFNLFLTDGKVLWQWKFIKITEEGLVLAGFMALRLIYLVVGSTIMTLTTTPNALTQGMEKGLGFLKVFRVPVHEIAMMMSKALRFIPILMEETDKIMKAQMARGAHFESGNIIQKARAMVPLLVPLFVSAFRRATDLAMAMEARCYHGGEGRTQMKPLHYRRADRIAYAIQFLFLAAVIACRLLF